VVRVRGLEPLTRRLAADVADLGAPCCLRRRRASLLARLEIVKTNLA
jgi:hypothetical protein